MNDAIKLRPLETRDAPFMLEWMQEPSIAGMFRFDAESMTIEGCMDYITQAGESENDLHYAIADRNDEYLGTISLKNIDKDRGEAEYAISTRKKVHGMGVAAEATEKLLNIAFETLGLKRVYLNVMTENIRANKFYQKCGFVLERTEKDAFESKGKMHDLNWYTMEKPEQSIAVSVAVITYNMERYLPQLLDSILMQKTDFRYEIVVDDDNSPDNSRKILRDYESRYPDKFVLSLRNRNVGGSMNMYGVLRQCRGKYIAILEGDDWWDWDGKLQYQYDFMESHPEYIGMYCNSWCELSTREVIRIPRRKITDPMVFSYKDFMNCHFFDRLPNSTDTAFFRNFFADADEREVDVFYKAHNMVWDQSLALILYGKGDVYVDPKLVSHHRTIVEKGGMNYQSLYAVEDHKVSDANMYAHHEEYMENVLKRNCTKFYKVRGMLFAEAFWTAKKTKKAEDKVKYKDIWNQRRKKWPLVLWAFVWGCGTVKRKFNRHK